VEHLAKSPVLTAGACEIYRSAVDVRSFPLFQGWGRRMGDGN
jgi:hypothetical protein